MPDCKGFLQEVEAAITELGGKVFPKLNWSSPQVREKKRTWCGMWGGGFSMCVCWGGIDECECWGIWEGVSMCVCVWGGGGNVC